MKKAEEAHRKMSAEVAEAHTRILETMQRGIVLPQTLGTSVGPRNSSSFATAQYFYKLKVASPTLSAHLGRLLSNKLIIDSNLESGLSPWDDSFFCLETATTDLPWDVLEIDW
jgi:hypothetical protein